MAAALVTQIAYAVQTLFDPAGTAGRLVDLGKLANYGLLTSFTPGYLFTAGVNGAWYDPSDFSTMFQNAAGTTPVTAVEQPVGLMLDKSKGLVPGGQSFSDANLTFIGASSRVSAGVYRLYSPDGAYSLVNRINGTSTPPSGTWFVISFSVDSVSVAGSGISFEGVSLNTNPIIAATVGVKTAVVSANGAATLGIKRAGFAMDVQISNISVRELPGNHAYNSSGNSANFPVLSARYNLLISTEDITSASWQKLSSGTGSLPVVTPGQTDPLGGTTAFRVRANRGAGNTSSDYSILRCSTSAVTSARRSLWVKSNTGETQTARLSIAVPATQISITTSWQLITNDSSDSTARFDLASFGTDGTTNDLDILIWHPDMRVPNDALNQPAYQRVNTATDYDTVGFKPYLSFNGVNQWLQTNSIDFTYGDKMFVSAGVRKLSDAARGMVSELGNASATFAFRFEAPVTAANNYTFVSVGTLSGSAVYTNTAVAAPTTNVISGIGDISGDQAVLRANGAQAAISTVDQGSGNYGNTPLYIGARGGTSLFFNGRLYGLVVAGKAASASEIASTEAWLNQKTGAY